MTSTSTVEPADPDSWTPQHWSRTEWFYMWTKGLDPWRIAVLCRVPYRKVYEHIRNRIAYNPDLFGHRLMLHDQPALPRGGLKKPRPTWEERAAELADFRQGHGRFPRGYIEGEQQLYTFMQYQRQQYRAGKLPDTKKTALDARVPGWLTPPKVERERILWEQRVRELERFFRTNERYPRYKTATDPLEKVLAVWLERQRHLSRIDRLDTSRRCALDERVPAWRNGTDDR